MSTLNWPCFTNGTVFKTGFFCQNCTALVHRSSLVGLGGLGWICDFEGTLIEFPRTTLRLLGCSVGACGDYLIAVPATWV
jgi:hypothetical protein